jgi:sarcosine oxidase subunit alpha
MARRLSPPREPVDLELDGERIVAERGEPIAFSLIAAGKVALSRSPKLHRPHGPYCLRGGCDGCLLRVDGEPNVMTCMTPCRGGERVETQNVLGSRKVDLMQVTDWFFPQGIDHHHFLAGVPAASYVVQKIARHVAGLGKLPDDPRPIGEARRMDVDVLVVGGGPAGLGVGRRLASMTKDSTRSLAILVADDGVSPGGSLLARGASVPDLSGLDLFTRTTAAGVYEREVLLVRDDEAIVARPRLLVLATGTHDGVATFPGNDLPGVFSARAAALLAQSDIAVGERVALFGTGPYLAAWLERMSSEVEVVAVPAGASIAAEGRGEITSIVVTDRATDRPSRGGARKKKRHEVDALLVEVKGAPSFELAEQAGIGVDFDPARGGYVPRTDENGRALPWVWCAGELTGIGSSLAAVDAHAEKVAADVKKALADLPIPR